MLFSTWWGILIIVLGGLLIWLTLSVVLYKICFKRIYDILFSLLALPFFVLLYIPISLLIKIEDKGPVFYNGKRLGKSGKIFKMCKFRSMYVNAPDIRLGDGSTFNSENDPRVTRIGRFLRKTSLDEIPQLLNILIGQMSFIGPRPDLPESMELLTENEKVKLKVRPGVTGYSQAYVRNSVVWKERLQYDCLYVRKVSFFFDIKIIFATIKTVLLRKNLYSAGLEKEISSDSVESKSIQENAVSPEADNAGGEAIANEVVIETTTDDAMDEAVTDEVTIEAPPEVLDENN